MANQKEQNRLINELLQLETALEKSFIANSDFVEGLFWGKPRYGHPEGKVILHIREVLDNIERIPNLDKETREKLRIIALSHDTFKFKECHFRKLFGKLVEYHHATIAANFLKELNVDERIVTIVQHHDEAYYAWKLLRYNQMDAYQKRLDHLIQLLGDDLQLYYLFFKCDTQTGDKTQDPMRWFETTIKGIDIIDF